MTKAQIKEALLKRQDLAEGEVTNADQTIDNIKLQTVKNGTEIEDGRPNTIVDEEPKATPTQGDIEKLVAKDEGPMIPADEDGISKDGGKEEFPGDDLQKAREKENEKMKDVINVADRKVGENTEVQADLLNQLQEAAEREVKYQNKIKEINKLCSEALKVQREKLVAEHAEKLNEFFEKIIVKGESLEKELKEAADKNMRAYKSAKKLYESSLKMNKMLLETVKKSQPKRELTRYVTAGLRAVESI